MKKLLSIISLLFISIFSCFIVSCKENIKCIEHTWQDWNTVQQATCVEYGIEMRLCAVCGETEKRDVSTVAHINENGKCSTCEQSIYRWFDTDGTLLYETVTNEPITQHELPEDNDKWDYISWQENSINDYYAYRKPKNSYFIGNVFQIVINDLESPIGFGSGFVFNSDGWFITNAHVMENAYTAQAIFEIPNESTGESFTYLDISKGSYYHRDKDLYIGKIENYHLVKSYYQEISVNLNHEIGEKTYSVGYPNATTFLEIASGKAVIEHTSLKDKLYGGNSYVYSTSHIAPGSSGGVLVNDNLEVIGITTHYYADENDEFIVGGAISVFNFKNLLTSINDGDLITLEERFYGDKKAYIGLFNDLKDNYALEKVERYIRDDGVIYYQDSWNGEGTNSDTVSYTYEEYLFACADGLMQYTTDYYWSDGGRRKINFYGYYSDKYGFSGFVFEFRYEWSNGNYYEVYCDNINYSENVGLTLKNYKLGNKSYGYTISEDNIAYVKEQFNCVYETLYGMMAIYNQ